MATKRAIEAVAIFEEFYKQYPDDREAPENLLEWSVVLMGQDDQERSLSILQMLTNEYPDNAITYTAQLWIARIFVEQVRMREAKQLLETLVNEGKVEANIRANAGLVLASIYESQTNTTDAIDVLESAEMIANDPEFIAQSKAARARLMVKAGDIDKSIKLLHEGVQGMADEKIGAQTQLDFAQLLLNLKAYEQANTEFQNYLEGFSFEEGEPYALLGKGWSFLELTRYAEAATAFEKAYDLLDTPSEKSEALLSAADAHFTDRQYAQAHDTYAKFVQQFPDDPARSRVTFNRGVCLAQMGKLDLAQKTFETVKDTHSSDSFSERAAIRLAVLKEDQGLWDDALMTYEEILKEYPDGPFYVLSLHSNGLIRYRLGAFKEALLRFNQVIEQFPESEFADHAFYMKGWCLYLLNENENALTVFRDFLQTYPTSKWASDALFSLAEYYYNSSQYSEAEKKFAEVADQFPEHDLADEALFWAGRSASAQKEYLRAIDYYNKLAKTYPNSSKLPEARFAHGDALSELGEFSSAILIFEEIIKKNPDSYLINRAWGRKGDCQFTLGVKDQSRYKEALLSYQTVLETPSASQDLKLQTEYKTGRCYEKMKDINKAFEHYMNVVYEYLALRKQGQSLDSLWFTRAVFAAGGIKEKESLWRDAVNVYKRLVSANVPAAGEAQKRIQKIRFEHWVLF